MFRTNAWNRFRYTLWSPIYNLILRSARPMRRRSLELLKVQPGERVLIVGAGTGLDLEFLPTEARVIATDLTAAMLRKLHKRAGSNVVPLLADAQRLCFADDSFDVVILHFIVAVVPDPISTIREAARVLRPGGRAVVLDKFAPDDRGVPAVLRILNPVANVLVTEVTRRLHPIVAATELQILREEPLSMGGFFKVAVLAKPPLANRATAGKG